MKKGRKLVPVTYSGITYESVYDCAAAFGLSANVVRWRLKHSLPLEPALNFRRMVTYDGRVWSVRELAERCGVSPAPSPAACARAAIPPSPGIAAGCASTAGSGIPAYRRSRVSWVFIRQTRVRLWRMTGGGYDGQICKTSCL